MRNTISILLLTLLSACNGQTTVLGHYDTEEEDTLSFVEENRIYDLKKTLDGNDLLIVNGSDGHENGPYKIAVRVSPEGDTISSHRFSHNNFYSDLVELRDCYYVATTAMRTMGGYTTSYLNKYNKNWKLIWTKEIKSSQMPDGKILLAITDNKELLVVSDELRINSKPAEQLISVKRFSLEGKMISVTYYYKSELNCPISLLRTNDNNFLLSSYTGTSDSTNLWVIKLNQEGDSLWTKEYGSMYVSSSLQLRDSTFLFYGEEYNSKGYTFLRITKIDQNGQILWDKNIAQNYMERPGNIIETPNGNCLFSSTIEPKKDFSIAWIFEIQNDGIIINERKFQFSVGIGAVPLLSYGRKGILMYSEKWRGKPAEAFDNVILVHKLKEQ